MTAHLIPEADSRAPTPATASGPKSSAVPLAAAHAERAHELLGAPLLNVLFAIQRTGSIAKAARAMGLSYRHVWGLVRDQESLCGEQLVSSQSGQAATLTTRGERVLWAMERARARLWPGLRNISAEFEADVALALGRGDDRLRIMASDEPALGALDAAWRGTGAAAFDLRFSDTAQARQSIDSGEVALTDIAIPCAPDGVAQRNSPVHLHAGPGLRLGQHKLIRLGSREVGLLLNASTPDLPARVSLADVLAKVHASGARFVLREPESASHALARSLIKLSGAGLSESSSEASSTATSLTQHAAQRALRHASTETTHLGVAACVASGAADVGFGLRTAAAHYGLGFAPLATEQIFLVCLKQTLDDPRIESLRRLLASAAWHEAMMQLPGHRADGAGQVVSLRSTLPWYKN
jgi:putative molybdopterin biosynthesis protein